MPESEIGKAMKFGQTLGIIFQIRDDIFDYYDSSEIGKPTGNDMAEGKLTLPAIYAVNNSAPDSIRKLAYKVKERTITLEEMRREAMEFIETEVTDDALRRSLEAYLSFVIERTK